MEARLKTKRHLQAFDGTKPRATSFPVSSCHLQFIVFLHMRLQTSALNESIATNGASEPAIVRMYPLMSPQSALPREGFLTKPTLERSIITVRYQMIPQMPFLIEGFTANGARVVFLIKMNFRMTCQFYFPRVFSLTNAAFEETYPVSHTFM